MTTLKDEEPIPILVDREFLVQTKKKYSDEVMRLYNVISFGVQHWSDGTGRLSIGVLCMNEDTIKQIREIIKEDIPVHIYQTGIMHAH